MLYQYAGRETHTTTIKLEAKNADIPFYGLADLLELLGTHMMKLGGIVIGIRIPSFFTPTSRIRVLDLDPTSNLINFEEKVVQFAGSAKF